MNEVLLELYRHKTWATLALIDFCKGVREDVLDASRPGTYGSIRETFRHLVRSEEGYLGRVMGRRVLEPMSDEEQLSLAELAERVRTLGPHWESLAHDTHVGVRKVTTSDGWRLSGAVVMAQAIHHADDHRTQVMSILGASGLEVPELDLWMYADAVGEVEHIHVPTGQ